MRSSDSRGFTLLELIVTLFVILLTIGLAVGALGIVLAYGGSGGTSTPGSNPLARTWELEREGFRLIQESMVPMPAQRSADVIVVTAAAGVFLLVLIGLIIFGVGAAFVVRGARRSFEKHLDLPAGVARKGIVTFGIVGYIAKGIAVAVAGVLFVVAAVTHDPQKAGGLDAALHTLAELPLGAVILWVVAAGLIIYGVFCFARARYARM